MANSTRTTISARPRGERKGTGAVPSDVTPDDARPKGTTAGATSPVGKLLLTPQEAAHALGINRSTLYTLLRSEEIASITIGRARRIPDEALEEWIAQHLAA
jgi:excisionase family DNA binding protein